MRIYSLYTLLLLLTLCLNSCLFTEDDVFDDTAAQRLNHALSEAETALSNGTNGWVMEYFPTNETEGYTFLMMFNPDGKADVASKNKYISAYTLNSGCWEVIGDNGPVLSFNTFINNFHLFSDPRNPGQAGYNGVGLAGDYEFIILNVDEELIRMKGKKRGTDIALKKLNSGQEWEDYFTVLEEMDAALFSKVAPVNWTLTIDGKVYILKEGNSHIFTATPEAEENAEEGDEEAESDLSLPFIVTDYGIRLAQPFIVNDVSVQSFVLNDDKQSLSAVENNEVRVTGVADLADYFVNNRGSVWKFDNESLPAGMKQLYDRISQSCVDLYAANEISLSIAYTSARATHSLRLSIVRNNGAQTIHGNLDLSSSRIDNESIAFSNTGRGDNNGNTFYTRIEGLSEMLELLSASFQLSTTNLLNPTDMKFIDSNTKISFQTYQ